MGSHAFRTETEIVLPSSSVQAKRAAAHGALRDPAGSINSWQIRWRSCAPHTRQVLCSSLHHPDQVFPVPDSNRLPQYPLTRSLCQPARCHEVSSVCLVVVHGAIQIPHHRLPHYPVVVVLALNYGNLHRLSDYQIDPMVTAGCGGFYRVAQLTKAVSGPMLKLYRRESPKFAEDLGSVVLGGFRAGLSSRLLQQRPRAFEAVDSTFDRDPVAYAHACLARHTCN